MLGAHLQKTPTFHQQKSCTTALNSSSAHEQQQSLHTKHHRTTSQYYHRQESIENDDSLMPPISGAYNACDTNNSTSIDPIANMMLNTVSTITTTAIVGGGPQCVHCGKIYSNASNLRQHVRNVHSLVDKSMWHKCNACGKRLKTKHYLINHQLQAHGIHQRG